ncbi:hypothetical protein VKT23_002502 [Stygiomarasmius scandens]|uniref:Uncharacterized protein n=1 Tax=Marasmiellus scandens TaxID=2682957 RepID=A0ABR1K3C9_9AGAR
MSLSSLEIIDTSLSANGISLSHIAFKPRVSTLRAYLGSGQYNGVWPSVRHLEIGSIDTRSVTPVQLPSCPCIYSLVLKLAVGQTAYPNVMYNTLRVLTLASRDLSAHDADQLIVNTVLPRLQHLILRNETRRRTFLQWDSAIQDLVNRSGCLITKLTLDCLNTIPSCYIAIFKSLPALTMVTLNESPPPPGYGPLDYGPLFRQLRLTAPEDTFCDRNNVLTKMTDLHLTLPALFAGLDAFYHMIESRLHVKGYHTLLGYQRLRLLLVQFIGNDDGLVLKDKLRKLVEGTALTLKM